MKVLKKRFIQNVHRVKQNKKERTCTLSKRGPIIRSKKIIQKNLTFVLVFGTRIGLNQFSLFVLHAKNVEYC